MTSKRKLRLLNENDYQGKEYQFTGWDELTEFTESQYSFVAERVDTEADEAWAELRGARQAALEAAQNAGRDGWIPLGREYPPLDSTFEVLHFGHCKSDAWIIQSAVWDKYGICPMPLGSGEHAKRYTITHWRLR